MIPSQPAPFLHKMPRLSARLAEGLAVKVVAIGSSTTAGEGNIVPYPQRLENALRSRYPGQNFDVMNRGIGGEEAPQELLRLKRDVICEQPTVVIWQVGTNAVWQKQDLNAAAKAVHDGLAELAAKTEADLVLMDLQYVPAVLTSDKADAARHMVMLIEDAATNATVPVNVFKRFDLMRDWHQDEKISFDRLVDPNDPDRLHHSDWSVNRMANALADLIFAADLRHSSS